METLTNRHTRVFSASPEAVRPWLESAWSGGARDIFPHDVVPSWRSQDTLVPNQTRLGHGPFRFTLREWDGWSWKVDFPGGWHGWQIEAEGDRTRLTHTLHFQGPQAVAGRLIIPLHDWAVEAMLDRLGAALETGSVPSFTERPLTGLPRLTWRTTNHRVHNRHTRHFPYSIEALRPWIEDLWSGGERDAFPRDYLPSFRKPLELVPGVTKLGHGPARFLFQKWDGHSWECTVRSNRMTGRHGFVLTPENGGTRLTHVLELTRYPFWEWALVIRPIHDWAVEALFDRLGTALDTGSVPVKTDRRIPWVYHVVRRLGVGKW